MSVKKNYLILLLLFPTLSFGNVVDTFFDQFKAKSNYYIYKDKQSKWNYDCLVYANMTKKGLNINTVNFDKKKKSIQFTFDSPDHPFYKVSKIKKIDNNHYKVVFYDEDGGINFNFDVTLKNNGISEWDYHDATEESDNFIDRGFTLISFDSTPKFQIINKCKL
ncbi:hypothetical protein [Acinetobacter wuhouensis]|uniref:hypothetical protein n=1 Tax=Acinetobacter wuhouensis TaxID=1879050 RepID=UPI001D190168|nr:hypothetical protein [Acinetobacter wuhouensis]